jgi:hypothetical protein
VLRRIGGVVAGLAIGVILIMIVEDIGVRVYPPPAGIDIHDTKAMQKMMASMPIGAFLFVLAGFLIATTAASFVASRIARRSAAGIVVGALFLVAGIANLLMVPHPIWFWIACIVVFIAATIAGTRLGALRVVAAA